MSFGSALWRFVRSYLPIYVLTLGLVIPRGDLGIVQIVQVWGVGGLLVGAAMMGLRCLRNWAFSLGAVLAAVLHAINLHLVWRT